MFSRKLKPLAAAAVAVQNGAKNFSTTSQRYYKVTLVGAAGGIGRPLALLMKTNPLVTELALYDVAKVTPGLAVDVSHINTPAIVTGHKGHDQLPAAIKCSDLIIVLAGVPRTDPTKTRDDLFGTNATIVRELAICTAAHAPNAVIAMITNPVNSMVPICAEVLKKAGVFDPRKVLGVTTLDVMRACTFVAEINDVDPRRVYIPVIGGHSGITIVPVFSQSQPALKLNDQKKIEALTRRIQEAGNEVVIGKAGGGSSTLSMAAAAAKIASAVLRGFHGEPNVVECAYVASDLTESAFFSSPLRFGKEGVQCSLGYGKLNKYEEKLLKASVAELKKNIKRGVDYAKITCLL